MIELDAIKKLCEQLDERAAYADRLLLGGHVVDHAEYRGLIRFKEGLNDAKILAKQIAEDLIKGNE